MRELYSDKGLLQKIKYQIKKSNLQLKAREREKTKSNLLEGMN